MTIRIRLLDTVVAVDTRDTGAARLLSLLWSEMETGEATPADRTYDLAREDGEWVATAEDGLEAVHPSLWGIVDALRFRMLELCEERLRSFVTLHAAAVARSGDLVLLAGESGAGKSTLTLDLLEAGWSYLSDDLAPVSTATGLVHPFPKPIGVKDPAVWEAVRERYGGLQVEPPAGAFLIPPSSWRVATEPLPPRALLFPRFTPGRAVEVEELTPAQAVVVASAYLRRLDPPALALLKRVCGGAACFRLRYGSSATALEAIDGILDRLE